jgi:NOL1/NOP2/fmu family ribosome biogenesis protein
MALQWVLRHAVQQEAPIDALDLCAAPGGKSLIIADFLSPSGRLISNEIIRSRAHILQEVVVKWGASNVVVTNNKPADFSSCGMQFDLIVVDAPCSGEGMFRKDPEARAEWSSDNVSMCSRRQRDVLNDVLPALKENGVLVYSTCTFAPEENESRIAELLATGEFETIRWPVPSEWNVDVIDSDGVFAMRFLPHKSPGEGFFISALRRTNAAAPQKSKPKSLFTRPSKAECEVVQKNGIDGSYMILAPNGELYLSPFDEKELNKLASSLYLLNPGVHIGKIVHNELVPAHALALCTHLKTHHSSVVLTLEEAMAYLRGETISPHAESGWQRVTYDSCALGWVKIIGHRVNNYYPKEWRVKLKE